MSGQQTLMPAPEEPAAPPLTEAAVLDLIERHYARPGNGGSGEYAVLRQVRNAAGFSATRTFDAVVIGLWPSRGHELHVIEVKVSRSDWLRELRDPKKADDAASIADRFSVCAPKGVVKREELPATWGLLEVMTGPDGSKLRVARAAPLLHDPEHVKAPIPRGLLVAMLRAAGAVPDPEPPSERYVAQRVAEALTREREQNEALIVSLRERATRAQQDLQAFRIGSGVFWSTPEQRDRAAAQVRAALARDRAPTEAADALRAAALQIERMAGTVRERSEAVDRMMTAVTAGGTDANDH